MAAMAWAHGSWCQPSLEARNASSSALQAALSELVVISGRPGSRGGVRVQRVAAHAPSHSLPAPHTPLSRMVPVYFRLQQITAVVDMVAANKLEAHYG